MQLNAVWFIQGDHQSNEIDLAIKLRCIRFADEEKSKSLFTGFFLCMCGYKARRKIATEGLKTIESLHSNSTDNFRL